jgi:sporulation protein YlmC with PRC-barrel domain
MDIPIDVEVRCTDGVCGHSTAIVLNPVTQQVTHFVVRMPGLAGDEYLVPVDAITDSTPDYIQLTWDRQELAKAEPFVRQVFLGTDEAAYLAQGMASSTMMWPYAEGDEAYLSSMAAAGYEQMEQIPHDELAIHRGADVEATDGRVGQVDEFLIDRATGHITHLVLRRGHFWGERDVTIPVSQIARVEADIVHLKLDKQAVGELPSIPVHRK